MAELGPAPRYGTASLADVLPSMLARCGIGEHGDTLGLPEARAYGVLLVDGLGWRQLHETDAAPSLTSAAGRPIDTVAPSTTAAAITSLGTGRPPGAHGLLGYTVLWPGEVQPFNPLVWRVGLRGGGRDVVEELVPECLVPRRTMLEVAHRAGIRTTAVQRPEHVDNGLTRAALRGGRRLTADSLDATLDAMLHALSGDAPAIAYGYHPDVDSAGHAHGPHADEWREAVRAVDRAVATAASRLPDDVVLLVTSDHGMVRVEDEDMRELAGHPLLDEVDLVAGEPRMRTLRLRPGARPAAVADRWRETFGDDATVLTTDEAVGRGWFGPDVPPEHARRLGDVIAASHRGMLVHAEVDPNGGRLRGMHGSLTRDEMEIPLLVFQGGTT